MYDLLVNYGMQPLVADFIVHPEWLHMLSALLLVILMLGVAYIIRLDLDPCILGTRQSFSELIEKLVFYPAVAAILLWMYYYEWKWPDVPPQGFYINKFTIGAGLMLAVVLGRGIAHFIQTEKNRWDFFDQLPFYLMVEFQFAVPLVYYYQLERNGLMPKEELGFALACLFLGYFVVRRLLGRPTHLPRNPVSPWLWLFIAYILLTLIIFPFRLAAIKNIIQWTAFAACFLVTLAYIPDRRRHDAIVLTAVVVSLISTLWGFWKYFDLPLSLFGIFNGTYPAGGTVSGMPYFYRTPTAGRYFLLAGFFANPNYYGEYLTMVIYMSLGLLFATDSRRTRTFLAVSLAINAFEMVALYNRAGWLGMFTGGAFVLAGLAWARMPILKRISVPGLVAGVAGLVVILLLTGLIFNKRESESDTPLAFTPIERLKSMTDFEGDETFRNRLTMWRASRLMLTDPAAFPQRLIFGGGLGFFEVNYLPYQTQVLETYNFNKWFHNVIPTFRAHSDHFQMLVEAGIIGTGLYALVFIIFFAYGFRFLREEQDPARRFFALGILAATASLLAIAFFSFPLHEIEHGGLLFTGMALLVVEIGNQKRKRTEEAEQARIASETPVDTRAGKKKSRREIVAAQAPVAEIATYPRGYYITLQKRLPIALAAPLIAIALFLMIWGVYTQIINFKSQYYVVKGIATLRVLDNSLSDSQRLTYAQSAADYFWRAYQLDPTNGRAEFFHGFALTKKNTYEDVVSGVAHLEEGQLLYPQSDTYYALAMGYEARQNLASGKAQAIGTQMNALQEQIAGMPAGQEKTDAENRLNELTQQKTAFQQDAKSSLDHSIDAYMTAAQYYPVKVEYYKELIRLLQEENRYEEMIFWANRAIIVWDWLREKPRIKWQLELWVGQAHRALGAQAMQAGDEAAGLDHWNKAEQALLVAKEESNAIYYAYYELGQLHEAEGELAARKGDMQEAMRQYAQARDMYVETFNRKDNVPSGQAPFDYAYLLLGRIYEKLGDPDRALTYYSRLLTGSLYSKNTRTYQYARERIHALTGQWRGEPPDQPLQGESVKDEPASWLPSPNSSTGST